MADTSKLPQEEECLFRIAGLPAGLLASRPLYPLVFTRPWLVGIGWGALALAIAVIGAALWSAILSLWYERSRLPVQKKRTTVILASPAVPIGGLLVSTLLSTREEVPWTRKLLAVGIGIGSSLTMSFLLWGSWRFLLWVERRRRGRMS